MANFLMYPIFQDVILPFILIFVLIFAILQKTKLLGDGVNQINAVISFVIAAIFVAFSTQVSWLKDFSVFLAIGLFVLFVFMLIYGFAYADNKEGFKLADELKIIISVIAFISVVVATLIITETWDNVYNFFTTSNWGSNILFIILIAGAIIAVLFGTKKPKKD